MKNHFLLMLLVGYVTLSLSISSTHAQHSHQFCGVGIQDGQAIKNRMFQNRRDKTMLLKQFEVGRGNDSTVWIPLQFHIVTKFDGTGGERVQDILDNLCKLNEDYKEFNVEYYLAGPINYVGQDILYTNDNENAAAYFMGMYRVPNVVNIYIGNTIVNNNGGTTLGYYTPAIDAIYVIKNAVSATASTLTHELGHFFSLPHTFLGWEQQNYDDVMVASVTQRTPQNLPSGALVEKIVRSGGTENCQIAADGFCDTEANYLFGYFGNTYNNGCDYIGLAADPDGILFLPDAVRPYATKFVITENDNDLTSVQTAHNLGYKGVYYAKTVITGEPMYVMTGDTFSMNIDTLGQNDTTAVKLNTVIDDLIGLGAQKLDKGILTMGDFSFETVITATNSDLSCSSTGAVFTVQAQNHGTFFSSIRVENTSPINTVSAGTVITITENLKKMGGVESMESWILSLPNAILPGGTYVFNNHNQTKSTIAGVGLLYKMASISAHKSGTTSENIMSYYGDNCVTGFSEEQKEAVKVDIASRGFATLYDVPLSMDIITTATLVSPVGPAVVSNPTINFEWSVVNGATYYYLDIYELSILGQRLIGGEEEERLIQNNNVWVNLTPGKSYGWTVTPINADRICDRASLQSTEATFSVSLNVDVSNIEKNPITSSVYPNPVEVGQEVILEVSSKTSNQAKISILNHLGQVVMQTQVMELEVGATVQKIDVSSLAAGFYVITITNDFGVVTHKLQIKQ